MSDWRGLSKEQYSAELLQLIIDPSKLGALFKDSIIEELAAKKGVNCKAKVVSVDGNTVVIRVECYERSGIVCVKCGHRSIKDTPPNESTRKSYLCGKCYGDKSATRALVTARQGGNCVIPGCSYSQANARTLDLHRVVPGRLGGAYVADNCVLVCQRHHRQIEGMDHEQLRKFMEFSAESMGSQLKWTVN